MTLKRNTGINMGSNLKSIQAEQKAWTACNFPNRKEHWSLLGVVEEVGELSHAFLKREQGIRDRAKEKDSIGDILIYLMDYCNRQGYDIEGILVETWEQVKERDWVKYPKNGKTE